MTGTSHRSKASPAPVKDIEGSGGRAAYVHLDVRDEAQWQQAVAVAEQRFGKLDVLVNSAGVTQAPGSTEQTTLEEWDRVIAVNTLADPARVPDRCVLDRLLRPSRLMMQALASHEAGGADLLITPDLSGLDVHRPSARQALIDAGERAAEAVLGRC